MAKEGSVAPKERVNITFKPAIGGAQEEVELPLKLLVLGDFTQREDVHKLEDRKPIAINQNTLDEVLAKQALSLTLNVPNRLQENADVEELAIRVRINSMKDFNPANLVEQIPELHKLMALREALMALKGPLGNTPSFRKAIENALADEGSRARVLAELGLGTTSPDNSQ